MKTQPVEKLNTQQQQILPFLERDSEREAVRELFIRMLSMKQFQGYVTSTLIILSAMLWNAVIS
jgi:hypothetical protein